MLRLDLQRRARWIDVGNGVRLEVEPLTTATMAAARRDPALAAAIKASVAAAGPGDEPAIDPSAQDELGILMAKAVARRVITAWDGVGDADGNPVEVTPEGIDALMDVWTIFDVFQRGYLAEGFLLESEKNGFAPSLNGTSAGATGTAKRARANAPIARKR